MATSTTAGLSIPIPAHSTAATSCSARRRRITPEAGRALEILGHAIEYLADEFVHNGGDLSARDPQVEAIQLLMARNRQVYYACPEIPTFRERCRAFLRAHLA